MKHRAAFGLPFFLNSMWAYKITTGEWIRASGSVSGIGYSGRGAGLNNPAMQDKAFEGPIPCGLYSIGEAFTHPHLGPLTMKLTPFDDQLMFGRSEMCCHGDEKAHAGQHLASDGCIIQDHATRYEVSRSQDRVLKVVSGL